MDDVEQAQAYSDADFTESHQRFVDEFVARFPAWQSQALPSDRPRVWTC